MESPAQLKLLAKALYSQPRPFLWSLRPFQEAQVPPPPAHGKIVPFVDQLAVLRHPAIAAFLMHGGYNSLSESVAAGVPLLVWPQMGDQYETSGWVVRNSLGARIVEGEGAGRLLNFAKEEADGWREKLRVEAEEMRRAWMDDGEAKEQLEAWIARFALGGGSSRL